MPQYKWIVDNEITSRKLDERNTLEVELIEKGMRIRVWEEPEDDRDKRKLMYHNVISHGQLGYLIPRKD